MTKNTKISCYWIFGSIIICTIFISILGYITYKKGLRIYQNIGYATGVLVLNTGPGGGRYRTARAIFHFDFNTEDKEMTNIQSLGYQLVSYKKGIENNKYLVIYDKKNPKQASILLDYPIRDTSSFDMYIEKFKTKPLNITPYYRMRLLFFLKDYSKK